MSFCLGWLLQSNAKFGALVGWVKQCTIGPLFEHLHPLPTHVCFHTIPCAFLGAIQYDFCPHHSTMTFSVLTKELLAHLQDVHDDPSKALDERLLESHDGQATGPL